MMGRSLLLRASFSAAFLMAASAPVSAQPFYENRTVTIIVGFGPGGGYDTMARVLARHMGSHMPGKPNFVVMNMSGASGLKSVNHLFSVAPRDGSIFGTFHSATPLQEALRSKAVRFKSVELSWVGSLSESVNVLAVTDAAGVRTLEEAKSRQVIMGAVGSGGGIMGAYPRLMNALLQTRFKIVAGYRGSNDVFLAMEREEVHGATTAWASWKIARPTWVRDGKVVPLVQIGSKKNADLPDTPLLLDLVKNEDQRRMVHLLSGNMQIERPFAGPPAIPQARLALLRRAFNATVRNTAFLADAKQAGETIDPRTGEEVAEIVRQIVETPAALVDRLGAATGLK